MLVLQEIAQEDYPIHSRVHQLKVGKKFQIDCYIKREDELGCLLSGSKVRKYRSVVAALKNRGCKKAGLIGGQFSNHVLGLSSLLLENSIEPTLFLLQTTENPQVGNGLFLELLVPQKNIEFVPRNQWPLVSEIAAMWQAKNSEYKASVIPEGGSIEDSIAGLATLALDIVQNEAQIGVPFKEILIDSGSGLTAASLIASFGLLKKKALIHVCLAASTPEAFSKILIRTKQALEHLTNQSIDYMPSYVLHKPPTAKSFGSTNSKIFQTIVDTAQTEGFFLDPLYSSKLYLLLLELLETRILQGPALFIHSGGLFSLSGFQSQLKNRV
jgi:1-aminocyclopropane-1-carboxylate deaminase